MGCAVDLILHSPARPPSVIQEETNELSQLAKLVHCAETPDRLAN